VARSGRRGGGFKALNIFVCLQTFRLGCTGKEQPKGLCVTVRSPSIRPETSGSVHGLAERADQQSCRDDCYGRS
jgi:hypothetical protein